MSARIHNYLKIHRKRWRLSQRELAGLLGRNSPSTISRYERGDNVPSRNELLACEVIFGVGPRELFPQQYQKIEDLVMCRAAALSAKIEHRTSEAAIMKHTLLQTMVRRVRSDGPV